MKPIRTFLLIAACAAPLLAAGQWQWIDKSGRRVFSDQPPPADVPDRNIVRQPAPRTPSLVVTPLEPPAAAASAPARPASTPASAAQPPVAGQQADARRRQAEAAEADKRRAEEERIARLRAENCTRARAAKTTLDSGQRMMRINEKGEREILDDAARAAESRRLDEITASDCR